MKKIPRVYCASIATETNTFSPLKTDLKDFKKSYEGKDIPRPANWTGIYIKPLKIEFWQHHGEYTTRLHDRIVFSKNGDDWSIERLYP